MGNATIEQHQKEILLDTNRQYMKELNILLAMQLSSNEVLLNTKGQYMKESNILEANATIKQQQKELLLNTKGLYMKESNIVVDNVTIKQFQSNLAVHKRAVHESNIKSQRVCVSVCKCVTTFCNSN